MIRGPLSRLASWLALAACSAVALLPAGGFSLCLGADGHVGVARADATVACPCAPAGAALSDRSGDEHPPCRDVEIASPDVYLEREVTTEGRVPMPPVSAPLEVAVTMAPAPRLTAAQAIRGSPRAVLPDKTLEARRSIVLLV